MAWIQSENHGGGLLKFTLQKFLWDIIPHIHNLPQVIYINWFGYEWFIPKSGY